jgi:hypothetical protein
LLWILWQKRNISSLDQEPNPDYPAHFFREGDNSAPFIVYITDKVGFTLFTGQEGS